MYLSNFNFHDNLGFCYSASSGSLMSGTSMRSLLDTAGVVSLCLDGLAGLAGLAGDNIERTGLTELTELAGLAGLAGLGRAGDTGLLFVGLGLLLAGSGGCLAALALLALTSSIPSNGRVASHCSSRCRSAPSANCRQWKFSCCSALTCVCGQFSQQMANSQWPAQHASAAREPRSATHRGCSRPHSRRPQRAASWSRGRTRAPSRP